MNLTTAFEQQADTCTRMGSPFMGRLLGWLSQNWDADTPLGQKLVTYQGDIGPAGHSLPLRLAGGLHALVLSGRDTDLAAVYPPASPDWQAFDHTLRKTLKTHEDFLMSWTDLPPQTNEVRRSAALIAMAHVALAHFRRPIVLSELGASGGLNLMWEHFSLNLQGLKIGPTDAALELSPIWEGAPPPPATPHIASRAGVDLNPLDPRKPEDLLRLTAYLWPDQPERLENTRRAANVYDAKIEKGDAIQWLERRLQATPRDHLHLIQNTVAWQYFPADAQARGRAMIELAGAVATPESPIGWMQMETDGDTTGAVGAALTLRLWPGDITLHLGRADFHGRWIQWAGA